MRQLLSWRTRGAIGVLLVLATVVQLLTSRGPRGNDGEGVQPSERRVSAMASVMLIQSSEAFAIIDGVTVGSASLTLDDGRVVTIARETPGELDCVDRITPAACVLLANMLGEGGFASRGFPVVAIFDVDPRKVDATVGELTVCNLDEMREFVRANGVQIGVLAVPSTAAQSVADDLMAAGIGSLLNFAPVVLTTTKGVTVRNVDLGVELQILGYHEQLRGQASAQPNRVSV